MAYLDRNTQINGLPRDARVPHLWVSEGIGVGVLGGAGVAIWFLILDMVTREPLYTPAALGSVFFFGAEGPQEIQRNFTTIGGYTILHFAAFMLMGMIFTFMVEKVQAGPHRWLIALMAFILLDGLFAGTIAALGAWVIASIGMWAIIVGNLIAIFIMAAALWKTHPRLHDLAQKPVQPTAI